MSDPRFSIIPAGAVLDSRLEPRDLQVLCLFGRHIDRKGWCRRSQVVMAKEIRCARSTVQASIERLVEAGWLQRRPANDLHTPGVRDSAHEYRVVLDTPDDTQDAVATLPTGRHTPADPVSAPPADIEIGTYVNVPHSNAKTPSDPPQAGEDMGDLVFDELVKIFPRRDGTFPSTARAAFFKLGPDERPLALKAGKHYVAWLTEEAEARGETFADRERYAPFLANWLNRGDWRRAFALPVKRGPEAEADLVVLSPNDPAFEAVQRIRGGKKIYVGKSGLATFTKAEVEAARSAQGLPA